VVVLRGDRVVPGMLIPDPDGAGFSFIAEGGPLPQTDTDWLLHTRLGGAGARIDADGQRRTLGSCAPRAGPPWLSG